MKKAILIITFFLFICYSVSAVISSSAYLTSNLINATGNGPIVYVPFNAVTFDDGNCFNLSNGSYIAPGNGTLIINGEIEVSNVTIDHKTLGILLYNATTSEQRYVYAINPYYLIDSVYPGYAQIPFSETMKCSTGDIFYLIVFVQGGTQTVTIVGGNRETRLSMNFFPN